MIEGFFHLLVSQLATRLLTFLLNLLSTRSLTPEAYGVAAVQFHLINTSILFVSREGFRRGCLRVRHNEKGATRRVLAVAALVVPVGAALSAAVTYALLWQQQGKPDVAYRTALLMQGVAAFVEILSEPLYILASTRLLFGLRMGVDTAAMVAKGAVLLVLVRGGAVPPAIAFSWAQLAYAGVVLAGYAAYFMPEALAAWRQQHRRSAGTQAEGSSAAGEAGVAAWAPDRELLRVSGAFGLQAVEKLFLAEGSKMVMAAVQSPRSQGVYGLVTNLGSLVVRTVFQPFEEAAFVAFSKAGAAAASGGAPAKPNPPQLAEQWSLLAVLVRAITTLGLLAAAFGPAYSYLALLVAYSSRWADTGASAALGAYSWYLVLLAGNGILEAYVHSVATRAQLQRINLWLVAFSGLHLGASVVAVQLGGASGLIAADGVNMVARIAYCLAFLKSRFSSVRSYAPRALLPAAATLAALVAAAGVTGASRLLLLHESAGLWQWWEARSGGSLPAALQGVLAAVDSVPWKARAGAHVLVGGVCLSAVCGVLLLHEREVLAQLRRARRGKQQDKQE